EGVVVGEFEEGAIEQLRHALKFALHGGDRLLLERGRVDLRRRAEIAIEGTAARGLDRNPVVGPADQQIEPRHDWRAGRVEAAIRSAVPSLQAALLEVVEEQRPGALR